jgi:hypothetical protein
MNPEPRVLILTPKFRVVELEDGNKTVEKFEGYDAMGGPRWRDLKFGEADAVSRLLRDWIFEHAAKCPVLLEGSDANHGNGRGE